MTNLRTRQRSSFKTEPQHSFTVTLHYSALETFVPLSILSTEQNVSEQNRLNSPGSPPKRLHIVAAESSTLINQLSLMKPSTLLTARGNFFGSRSTLRRGSYFLITKVWVRIRRANGVA